MVQLSPSVRTAGDSWTITELVGATPAAVRRPVPVDLRDDWDGTPDGGGGGAVPLQGLGLVLQHLGLVDLVDGGAGGPTD
ncbi:hypothetical protein MAHJHV57_51670 [Mycobacterium avium subsp. hominissuis]